jgi:anti-sigma factor ChrR (cupin superfamily)
MTMASSEDHGPASAYALGALDPDECAAFEQHVASCPDCFAEVQAHRRVVHDALAGTGAAPSRALRQQVLELTEAPRSPVDPALYTWEEPVPGIRMTTLFEDPARGLRKVLVWARPGAHYPSHRHLGDEEILVLQGALADGRAVYRAGDICRSRTGSVHSEQVVGDEDCFCFVVYHGGHESVPE